MDHELSEVERVSGPDVEASSRTGGNWYLAQCKTGQEHITAANLTRRALAQTFLPRERRSRRWRGRVQPLLAPVFPAYLFLLPGGEADWRAIRATRGLTRLASFGAGVPAPLNPDVVRELRRRCDEDDVLRAPEDFCPGEKVHVLEGAFAGMIATMETITPDARVTLLLDILGRETRVIASGSTGLRRTR